MSGEIFCSDLLNDQDMIKALGDAAVPLPHLFTDCCFSGEGENGTSLLISVERKHLGDICQCINDGRFVFQAQVCKEMGCDFLCLIVEGPRIRANPEDGLLEMAIWTVNPRTMRRAEMWQPVKPSMTYSRFDQYLTELQYLGGIIVKRSYDVKETATIIKSLWTQFQTPPSQHNSLNQIYSAPLGKIELVRPGLVRRMAKELDGIGWQRSRDVSQHFVSVFDMISASAEEWDKVPGVGGITAGRVFADIRGLPRPQKGKGKS